MNVRDLFGGYIHDFCYQNVSTKPLFRSRENKITGKADFQILLTCLRMLQGYIYMYLYPFYKSAVHKLQIINDFPISFPPFVGGKFNSTNCHT